ncbi:MAG: ribonuclease HII [Proteobacteria bacterium]|nr:ribonuclease HII [Pseudomonadota bacterium]
MLHYRFERALGGIVAGVDEAGRGPLAGPVVAAAVILMPALLPRRLLGAIDDSKVVPPEARAKLAAKLWQRAARQDGVIAAVAASSTAEIERINILQATLLAMTRAIGRLAQRPTAVLIDGNILPASLPCPGRAVIDGDAKSLSIAAASILAKVTRDRLMMRLAARYPAYGWERNAGYGTPEHCAGIAIAGPTRHHRMGFAPLRNLAE